MFGKRKFYSLKEILKKRATYNIIMGERSNGKTYAALAYAIEQYFKTGKQAVLIRRWQTDIAGHRGSQMFAAFTSDVDVKGMKLASSAGPGDNFSKEFEKYLAALCQRSSNTFYYTYCIPFRSNPMDAKQKMLEDLQKDHVAAAIRSIVFESGEQVSSRFREQGISPALCNYYLSVLADPSPQDNPGLCLRHLLYPFR